MPQNILQLNADKILIRGQDRANTYTVLAHSAKQQVLDKHVKSTLQSPQKHFKDQAAKNLEIVIHGFINSRLDFCNSSLSGISITFLSCHQLIQSSAARILTLTKRHDHITSILGSPWLPVAFGSDLKLFFLITPNAFDASHQMFPEILFPQGSLISQKAKCLTLCRVGLSPTTLWDSNNKSLD